MGVLAPDVGDVVRYTGGWLFDRAMAGWEVTVCVSDPGDARPLRILGATVLDLESSLSSPPEGVLPNGMAVAATVFESDPRVRDGLLHNLEEHAFEVAIWGAPCPSEIDCRTGMVEHRLSFAARAFKARALAALGEPTWDVDEVEVFRCGGTHDHLAADLLPVG